WGGPERAMTIFTVTTLADSGAGSLRQALADAEAASGDDTIAFAAGLSGGTVRLTSGQLQITSDSVHIDGDIDHDGSADITLSGDANNDGVANAGDSSILRIASGSSAAINGLVFVHGAEFGQSGAIPPINGRDGSSGQSAVGAISNYGTLTLAN